MPGMPFGFGDLIRRKYDIMQQQADTQKLGVSADANLTNIRAGLLPAESKAGIAKTQADTANTLESTKYIGPLAQAGIALQGAQGRLYGAQAANTDEETVGVRQINKLNPFGFRFQPDIREQLGTMLRLGLSPLGN